MKENILDFLNSINALNIGELIFQIVLAYIFIVWIAILFWTYRDINNRSKNICFKLLSILIVGVFNVFGLVIYLIIRPTKTLIEKSIEDSELGILGKYKNESKKNPIKNNIVKRKKRLIAKRNK